MAKNGIGKVDPYRSFNFTLSITDANGNNFQSAGFESISGMKADIDDIEYREGGDSTHTKHYPGLTKYDKLTCQRGMTEDMDIANWFAQISKINGDGSFNPLRKNGQIFLWNASHTIIQTSWTIQEMWISSYETDTFDAKSSGIAIEKMVITHNGFERDQNPTPSNVNA